MTTIFLFFVISGPQSVTFIDDRKRQRQRSVAINDGSTSGTVVDEDEHTITFPSEENL